MKYYIGWDVGAWKCTKANDASCDAIFVANEACALGHYRDNVSQTIQAVCDSSADTKAKCLIDTWFTLCGMDQRYVSEDEYCIAIDTPLGWPKSFSMLLTGQLDVKWQFSSKQPNIQNTLLFRRTERELGSSFSAVVDAIGSQSTKGIALLCALQAEVHSWGVWKVKNLTLVEAYPKACLRSVAFVDWMCGLSLNWDIREWYEPANKVTKRRERKLLSQEDNFDAGVCSCLARAFVEGKPPLKHPPQIDSEAELAEGWIFHPSGEMLKPMLASNYAKVVNAVDVSSLEEAIKKFRQHISQPVLNTEQKELEV